MDMLWIVWKRWSLSASLSVSEGGREKEILGEREIRRMFPVLIRKISGVVI